MDDKTGLRDEVMCSAFMLAFMLVFVLLVACVLSGCRPNPEHLPLLR